jgi:hypothetical protein
VVEFSNFMKVRIIEDDTQSVSPLLDLFVPPFVGGVGVGVGVP